MQPHAFACDSTRLPDAAADDRFAVHVFPADHGDCLWIEYGPRGAPRHLLIDAGTQRTAQRVACCLPMSSPWGPSTASA